MYVTLGAYTVCVAMCTPLQLENLITDLLDNSEHMKFKSLVN